MMYLIRGYTSRKPDYRFTVDADIMPFGDALRDIILAHFKHECDFVDDLEACDIFDLSEEQERSDLRDSDSQRVYLFNGEHCIEHGDDSECTENEHNCCESMIYMITVDVEGETK